MQKVWLYLLCTLLCTKLLAQVSFTKGPTPWPDIPMPPKAKVQWVSDDMRMNGVPMKIQTFESEASKEEVVAYYIAYWKVTTPPTTKPNEPVAALTNKGVDTMVTRLHGPFYSMVKVKDAGSGRSEGTISTSQMLGVEPKLDVSGVPAPQSAKPASVVEAIDNGKRNKQILFFSKDSLDSVAEYYQSHLRSTGWNLLQEQIAKPTDASPPAIVRMYARNQQQLDVAIGVDRQNRLSIINANLITYVQN